MRNEPRAIIACEMTVIEFPGAEIPDTHGGRLLNAGRRLRPCRLR